MTRGFLVAPITASFAIANVLDVVQNLLELGDYAGAVTALVNAPGFVTNAFINGYQPALTHDPVTGNLLTFATETFQGLRTPRKLVPGTGVNGIPFRYTQGGSIDQLFVALPRAIATARKPTVVTPPVVTPPLVTPAAQTVTPAAQTVTLDMPAVAAKKATTTEVAKVEAVTLAADTEVTDTVATPDAETTEAVADPDAVTTARPTPRSCGPTPARLPTMPVMV